MERHRLHGTIHVDFARPKRTRAHKAHISTQNVHQLRQFVERRASKYASGSRDSRIVFCGLHRTAQGTGMSLEDAQAVRLEPKGDFQAYMNAVWDATDAYLASADDAFLDTLLVMHEAPTHRDRIGRVQEHADLIERHLQRAEQTDLLRVGHLVQAVVPEA